MITFSRGALGLAPLLLLFIACSSSGGGTPCDATGARKPACLAGDPCECDDEGSHNADPICVNGAWACPKGYTRYEDCHGVPPDPYDPVCHPGASPRDAGKE